VVMTVGPHLGFFAKLRQAVDRQAPLIGCLGIFMLVALGQQNWFIQLRDRWNAETLLRQEQAVPPWVRPPQEMVLHVPVGRRIFGSMSYATGAPPSSQASWLDVTGWVGTTGPQAEIEKVIILIDGKPAAQSRQLRAFAFPDLFFDKADFLPLGWEIQAPLRELSSGRHTIAAAAVLPGGDREVFTSWQLIIPRRPRLD
jgi:hypothetical protein